MQAKEGDTKLTLKELAPVRLIKNKFYRDIQKAYAEGASIQELRLLLGRGRAKKGMFEGDLEEGELEIGQVSAIIHDIKPAAKIISDMMAEFNEAKSAVADL